jgi:hypothetical protein
MVPSVAKPCAMPIPKPISCPSRRLTERETDINEAHRKLLGDLAPIANDLSTFAFGFAEAIFKKHFGELTATVVAQIEDAPKIEDLHLPWFLETTSFSPDGEAQ